MNTIFLFGLASAVLVGLGLYGVVLAAEPLRRILAFNLLGSGIFLLFGVVARRGAAGGIGGDPIPQAIIITGIVVAFSASALAVQLLLRLSEAQAAARADSESAGEERAASGSAVTDAAVTETAVTKTAVTEMGAGNNPRIESSPS